MVDREDHSQPEVEYLNKGYRGVESTCVRVRLYGEDFENLQVSGEIF